MGLFKEFSKSSQQDWEDKINIDLKGKDRSSINWNFESQEVNPVLFDYTAKYQLAPSKKDNSWSISEEIDCSSPNANQSALEALSGGCNHLTFLNVDSTNLTDLLNEVDLTIIQFSFKLEMSPLETAEKIKNYLQDNYDSNQISGSVQFDPIGTLLKYGYWMNDSAEKLTELSAITDLFSDFPEVNTTSIYGDAYGNSGAGLSDQVALAISHAHEYVLNHLENNIQKNSIIVNFSVGTDFFGEIAKIRAFKILWNSICELYKVKIPVKLELRSSNLYNSNLDINNNLLRATTSAMSGVIAGCDSFVVVPHNYNTTEVNSFSKRIARNIQLILQEESMMAKVMDPSNGSYYIQSLTDQIIDSAQEQIGKLDGNFLQFVGDGTVQDICKSGFSSKSEQLNNQEQIMIGVNKFLNEGENKLVSSDLIIETDSELEILTQARLAKSFEG